MAAIALLALGGTISMRMVDGLAVPALDAAQVAGLLGGTDDVVAVDVARVGGSEVDFTHLRALATTLDDVRSRGVAAAIVTTGTDSIEETAAWLTYSGPWDIPVVVTGSMRPGGEPGGDAAANLAAAAAVARTPITSEPVVVFAGKVWLGRGAQKVSGTELQAFDSPGRPPLGFVADGVVRTVSPPPSPARALGRPGALFTDVPLLTAPLGTGGGLLETAAEGAAAVVLAGNGAGNLPPEIADTAVSLASSGVLVAVATRAADARTNPLYGYPGAGGQLARDGVIVADGITPHQLRVYLTLAVSQGRRGAALRTALTQHLESLT